MLYLCVFYDLFRCISNMKHAWAILFWFPLFILCLCRFDGKRHDIAAILVIILRVISGISCGAVSPSMYSLLGRWIPTYERSKLTVIAVSGQMVCWCNLTLLLTTVHWHRNDESTTLKSLWVGHWVTLSFFFFMINLFVFIYFSFFGVSRVFSSLL